MVQAKDVIDALLKIMPELTQDDAVNYMKIAAYLVY